MQDLAMGSIRVVLMHLDGTPASVARLEFARNVALRHEATLCAMFAAAPKHPLLRMALSESPAALLQWVDQAALERTSPASTRRSARAMPGCAGWMR